MRAVSASTTQLRPHHVDGAHVDELINFRKHRREYSVLLKLIELQKSAIRYQITEDAVFMKWFDGLQLLSEQEAYVNMRL